MYTLSTLNLIFERKRGNKQKQHQGEKRQNKYFPGAYKVIKLQISYLFFLNGKV